MTKNSKAKGSAFERQISAQLSLWWSDGKRDDIFWRSSSSGARATSRAQKNKTTANSAGDLCYLDRDGSSFISYFAVEIKRGYTAFDVQRVLDREDGTKPSILEQWIEQAAKSQEDAGAYSWLIIAKKNRAKTLAILPEFEYKSLISHRNIGDFPHILVSGILEHDLEDPPNINRIICMSLTDFLATVKPDIVKRSIKAFTDTPFIYKYKSRDNKVRKSKKVAKAA